MTELTAYARYHELNEAVEPNQRPDTDGVEEEAIESAGRHLGAAAVG